MFVLDVRAPAGTVNVKRPSEEVIDPPPAPMVAFTGVPSGIPFSVMNAGVSGVVTGGVTVTGKGLSSGWQDQK
jgi:hypothetical protein